LITQQREFIVQNGSVVADKGQPIIEETDLEWGRAEEAIILSCWPNSMHPMTIESMIAHRWPIRWTSERQAPPCINAEFARCRRAAELLLDL
jgi:hypothetical protein